MLAYVFYNTLSACSTNIGKIVFSFSNSLSDIVLSVSIPNFFFFFPLLWCLETMKKGCGDLYHLPIAIFQNRSLFSFVAIRITDTWNSHGLGFANICFSTCHPVAIAHVALGLKFLAADLTGVCTWWECGIHPKLVCCDAVG